MPNRTCLICSTNSILKKWLNLTPVKFRYIKVWKVVVISVHLYLMREKVKSWLKTWTHRNSLRHFIQRSNFTLASLYYSDERLWTKFNMHSLWHLLSWWNEEGGSWTEETCHADVFYSDHAQQAAMYWAMTLIVAPIQVFLAPWKSYHSETPITMQQPTNKQTNKHKG